MKILHLLNSTRFSGAENVVCQIIGLFREDPEIEMLYCSPDGPIRHSLEIRDVPFVLIERLSVREVRRVLREQRPDIIHAHDFRASMIAAVSARGIPVLSHLHNNSPWMEGYGMKSFAYAATCTRYSKILTVSPSVFDGYVFGDLFRKKLEVMGNPVDIREIREKARISRDGPSYDIGFFGRLTLPKNPSLFLEIVDEVKKEIPGIKAAMIGDGELRAEVEEAIARMDLTEDVAVYGFLDDPYPIVKKFKVLCMPSRWEGFGLTAAEALALGVPVVCSDVGGLPTIVDDSGGKLCREKGEYVREIVKILQDPEYYRKKHDGARRLAERLDNRREYKDRLRSIYKPVDT